MLIIVNIIIIVCINIYKYALIYLSIQNIIFIIFNIKQYIIYVTLFKFVKIIILKFKE